MLGRAKCGKNVDCKTSSQFLSNTSVDNAILVLRICSFKMPEIQKITKNIIILRFFILYCTLPNI